MMERKNVNVRDDEAFGRLLKEILRILHSIRQLRPSWRVAHSQSLHATWRKEKQQIKSLTLRQKVLQNISGILINLLDGPSQILCDTPDFGRSIEHLGILNRHLLDRLCEARIFPERGTVDFAHMGTGRQRSAIASSSRTP